MRDVCAQWLQVLCKIPSPTAVMEWACVSVGDTVCLECVLLAVQQHANSDEICCVMPLFVDVSVIHEVSSSPCGCTFLGPDKRLFQREDERVHAEI